MAIDDAGGQVRGIRIDYVSLDNGFARGGWQGEVINARKAAADASVVADIGPTNSGAARQSIPILCQAGLGMISPSATNVGLTKASPVTGPGEPGIYYPDGCMRNFSRDIPSESVDGRVSAHTATSTGATAAYIVQSFPQSPEGYGFALEASRIGLPIAGAEVLEGQSQSALAGISGRVAASGADFVYLTCADWVNDCARIIRDFRVASPTARIMLYDQGPPNLLARIGPGAEGLISVRGFLAPADFPPAAAAWYVRYTSRFGSIPGDQFNGAIYTYDATRVVLRAIGASRHQLDRAHVREALMSTTNFIGLFGIWSFDATGDTTSSVMSTSQVINGAWTPTGATSLP